MTRRRAALAVVAAVLLCGCGWIFFSWGIWQYVISVAAVRPPSPNSSKVHGHFLPKASSRGNVILIHGLNFDADKMLPVAKIFNDLGYQVTVPRMAGHRGIIGETFGDTSPLWTAQLQELGRSIQGPTVCAGYSMGALLLLRAQLSGDIKCERFVFFAPALATYTPRWSAELLRKILPQKLLVPTGIPGGYQHFDWTGMGPAWTLVRFIEELNLEQNSSFPPGLVFMDSRDQVIDAARVDQLLESKLPHWQRVEVEALPLAESHANHLIVDEAHLGSNQWQMVAARIQTFMEIQ